MNPLNAIVTQIQCIVQSCAVMGVIDTKFAWSSTRLLSGHRFLRYPTEIISSPKSHQDPNRVMHFSPVNRAHLCFFTTPCICSNILVLHGLKYIVACQGGGVSSKTRHRGADKTVLEHFNELIDLH